MIQSIEINKLRNSEYIQFKTQFLNILTTHNPTDLLVKPAYDVLVSQIATIENSFKLKQGSAKTNAIKAADIKRDECITGMYYYLLGLSTHFNETKRANAKVLLDVLAVYGSGIASQNFNAETATIRSLVNDLKLPENVAITTALGIADWVTEMETQNNNFDTLFLERNKESSSDLSQSIETLRVGANKAYIDLKDRLNSHYIISDKAIKYVNCINELNALIDYYNNLLKNRSFKNETDEGDTNDNAEIKS
jgi:hypothetical protein